MSIRSVLVPLLPQDEPSPMLSAALQIVRRFEGHLDEIYATLVVRLHYTDSFKYKQLY